MLLIYWHTWTLNYTQEKLGFLNHRLLYYNQEKRLPVYWPLLTHLLWQNLYGLIQSAPLSADNNTPEKQQTNIPSVQNTGKCITTWLNLSFLCPTDHNKNLKSPHPGTTSLWTLCFMQTIFSQPDNFLEWLTHSTSVRAWVSTQCVQLFCFRRRCLQKWDHYDLQKKKNLLSNKLMCGLEAGSCIGVCVLRTTQIIFRGIFPSAIPSPSPLIRASAEDGKMT